MAVPRNRKSKSRKNTKRAHMAITLKSYKVCAISGKTILPHTMSGDKETVRQRKKQIKASMTAVKTKTKVVLEKSKEADPKKSK
ncbi:50S ribosomal protein L32 [Chlamydiia bacterium]|jgi:ribosomal protein L32|nr:50S ribosomal protein L32 [Chlamydiia bacterium]